MFSVMDMLILSLDHSTMYQGIVYPQIYIIIMFIIVPFTNKNLNKNILEWFE
jgi:hypothetical protein